jgi:hypothetical protein
LAPICGEGELCPEGGKGSANSAFWQNKPKLLGCALHVDQFGRQSVVTVEMGDFRLGLFCKNWVCFGGSGDKLAVKWGKIGKV